MARPLKRPDRPLSGGREFVWSYRPGTRVWTWSRVYHRDRFTAAADAFKDYGPTNRFDHHRPDPVGKARVDPDRHVLYVARDIVTGACEVFGETEEALLCSRWRVARVRPLRPLHLLDLAGPGSALLVGALPQIGSGHVPRGLTQEWARALYEDQPLRRRADGVRYSTSYTGAAALAVWNRRGDVTTVVGSDEPLRTPHVLAHLTAELPRRGITVEQVEDDACRRCRDDA
ncbi:RES family NAD+ phosphorylase [Kineococcus sp. LSe6-4]|uniref:RES family NAD+ phosphorylase n=1 Tax=Kineococcus halophytocola TaxID=3234027 RepID=A0ABV4H603_9ACTN